MIELLTNMPIALPEMIILAAAVLALLGDLFLKSKIPSIALSIACGGLIAAGYSSYLMLGHYPMMAFNGLFISDDLGQLMKIFIYLSVLLSFLYSRAYLEERHIATGDYYVLGLFCTLGMMILVSAHSLLTIYLGLELLSLPLYAMAAIQRSNADASEAAMKYFVLGAIASGMLLYGISLLYGATGVLDLQEIATVIASKWQQEAGLLSFAMVFILAGVSFKLAAVPFHMWAPDVYQGAPTSVTLFISAAPKIAAMGMAFRILLISLPQLIWQWQHIILVMALLSTGIGNLLAISQNNIKRLFAYSAISHMGYALFGVLAGTSAGYSAALYYVLVYSLMSVAAFGFLVLLSNSGLEIEEVQDLKGLNRRNPWLAFMMMIVLFSMAGIPPTVGFFPKLLVLKALVDVHAIWVAVLGLLFAVMGTFYYLRIVKVMYFEDSAHESPMQISRPLSAIFSLNCLTLLIMGIFPSGLVTACMNAFS